MRHLLRSIIALGFSNHHYGECSGPTFRKLIVRIDSA